MQNKLCCLLNPEIGCGFCTETWCLTCYYSLRRWPKDACSVPNTSGSAQGNHYTQDLESIYPMADYVRPLKEGEKVTSFESNEVEDE